MKEISLFVNVFLLKSPKVLKVTRVICFSRVMKVIKCNQVSTFLFQSVINIQVVIFM